jgi:hypothetical protein
LVEAVYRLVDEFPDGEQDPMETTAGWPDQLLDRAIEGSGNAVVFVHRGPVDAEIQQALLAAAESHCMAMNDPVALRKRLLALLVEGSENLLRHTQPQLVSHAFMCLVASAEGYRMVMGNPAPRAVAEFMRHRIGILNEMDEAALKEQYLALLANTQRTALGGAGLGLFTMARKCARPMCFHTGPFDEAHVYAALELRLERQAGVPPAKPA